MKILDNLLGRTAADPGSSTAATGSGETGPADTLLPGMSAQESTEETGDSQSGLAGTPLRVSAGDLWRSYERNEIADDEEFGGTVLEVRGRIDAVTRDYKSRITVSLAVGEFLGQVICRFTEARRSEVLPLEKGGRATIRGTCHGRESRDVVLDACEVTQHSPPPPAAVAGQAPTAA